MSTSQLCQICLGCLCDHVGLQTWEGQSGMMFLHHFTPGTLEASANAKCPICVLLWKQLQPLQSQIAYESSKDKPLTFLHLQPPKSLGIEGSYELGAYINNDATTVDGIKRASVLIFLLQAPEDVERHYASQTMAHSTGSTECWDIALRWLNDCRSNHPECLVPDKPSWHPTRLLDIGTGAADVVRVVVSAETQPKDGYVTLSHRWGDGMTTKLTKASFQDLKSGIALQQLPLTFQHAIEIAKRLDKRYIWIDSLCIFQDSDDKSDWLKEAALMDKVYSNSFLNISATAGYDSSQGLFVTRNPEFELRPIRISCPTVPASNDQASQIHNFIMSDVLLFERELMSAPLNRRAWVL